MPEQKNIDILLKDRFAQLPPVLQQAITSAEVEEHLRELSRTYKLHLDQWQKLENEVTMTLLGLELVENLSKNLIKEVGVPAELARSLASDINKIVFAPIRSELEKVLSESAVAGENAGEHDKTEPAAAANTQAKEIQKKPGVVRGKLSSIYAPGEASHERRSIEGDPYREPVE